MEELETEDSEVVKRRSRIAKLYLQGATQQAIASLLSVSQSTVSKDLAHCREEWRKDLGQGHKEHQATELRKIALLERAAWRGWNQSMAAAAAVREEGSNRQPSSGESQYLQLVNRCILQRRALLSLDMPRRPPNLQNHDVARTVVYLPDNGRDDYVLEKSNETRDA